MDRVIEKKRWTWQRIVLVVVIVAVAGFFLLRWVSRPAGARLNVDAGRIILDTVHRAAFREQIPVTGAVLPIRSVVIAAVEGGRVEEKFVEDGAMLKSGQLILRLSNPDLQLSYLNQEADIINQISQIQNMSLLRDQQSLNLRESALDVEYRIDLLSKRLKRTRSLARDGVVSKVELQEMEDEYNNLVRRKALLLKTIAKDSLSGLIQSQQMDNSLDLMRRNLAISRQNLDNLLIKAPIDGQLSGLSAELGESVQEGIQLAQIDDLSAYKVRVRIDEFYISRIYPEQKGFFIFTGKTYELKIAKIYPQVANGAFEADMAFTGPFPAAIKRGQTLSVNLELSAEQEALLISRSSFYQSTNGKWVYVLNPGGQTAVKRAIRLGRQNPSYYEVLEGLQAGEVVIVSGYEDFGEKDILQIK
ncbi:MAG: efflux RND transporter periplasmic adaptor subunit [Saprospiraceae bacterium]|nr:efflux RND transporter periplasmic adaptor subunit [Saprospiraceae bacterium]